MSERASLYIMEPFWDRQRYETASYCLTMISLYFTAMAKRQQQKSSIPKT